MALRSIGAQDALETLQHYSTIIDARSQSEWALDHLPDAVNWPTLTDSERHLVGMQYKQINAFEAKKRGAAMAAKNIAAHIENHVVSLPKSWRPLIYCWRGGKRSAALALILAEIGFEVTLIEGGYKAFRAAILQDTQRLAPSLTYRVLCGPTGSGKTRLLHSLAKHGAQVLDLEELAQHRSSVLGKIPGQAQPSQKHFEMRIWAALRRFDATRTVWVESESKKVGNVCVPDCLMAAIRASACVQIEMPLHERVNLLLADYAYFVQDAPLFCKRLDVLRPLRGHALVDQWQAQIRSSEHASVVRDLLEKHYDPGYLDSTTRNFPRFSQSYRVTVQSASELSERQWIEALRRDCE